ncbi:MAG: hypothetical protein VSS75_023585 [Candidatus Parabeggiatoa sp.]|nr:hypothetical protein [Candidatus Parabeggiatoa sp.]
MQKRRTRKMKQMVLVIILFLNGLWLPVAAHQDKEPTNDPQLSQPIYKPFIERYILDELKQLRQDQQAFRAEVAEKVAHARLDASDRTVRYTTDTINIVFFIITAAASILVLVGWNSVRDMKSKVEEVVNKKVADITLEYEKRLDTIEAKLKQRSEQILAAQEDILAAQEEISKANTIHSLWMRSGLETNLQTKIEFYDEILKIKPEDVEAISYKADAVLELGEGEWALNLSNMAISFDVDYGYAYWQRACAHAELGNTKAALEDIKIALDKSPNLKNELVNENAFKKLRGTKEFAELRDSENIVKMGDLSGYFKKRNDH